MKWIVSLFSLFAMDIVFEEPFEEYKEDFVSYFDDHRLPPQKNREELLAYIQEFTEKEYSIYKIKNFWIYSSEDFPYREDPLLDTLFRKYVKKGSTVIDCGAENGLRAVKLAKLVKKEGKIIACESNKQQFRELFWNLELNSIQNIQLYCHFFTGKDQGLDALNLENVSFIRIDARGKEDLFISGGRETIRKCKPILLINMIGGIPFESADKFVKQEFNQRLEEIHNLGYTTERINASEYLAVPL